ncbi:MAG: site-specific integrase [Alphaproteobacteria bacterium]|nr:site-specific integrase [Alphaproteobacteria bacterium]
MINNTKTQYNPKNERIKQTYKNFIARVEQKDEKTVFASLKNIREFELGNNFINFENVNPDMISNYIKSMIARKLSLSFVSHNVKALKDFYFWLGSQNGFRNKIDYNTTAHFRLSNNQRREAMACEYQESYDLEDILATIRQMPDKTLTDKRNKAIISLQALCGLRISELRTIKMKNLKFDRDANNDFVFVSPKDMKVKFAKTRHAFFMPFAEDIKANVFNWRDELIKRDFKDKDPFFPIINARFSQSNLLESSVSKEEICSNTTILSVFKKNFKAVGLPYYRPHSFRHTIVRWAERQSPEFFNAVSQSLGHSDIKTTFQAYGQLPPSRIGDILKKKEG